jgi:hypothetical protein
MLQIGTNVLSRVIATMTSRSGEIRDTGDKILPLKMTTPKQIRLPEGIKAIFGGGYVTAASGPDKLIL